MRAGRACICALYGAAKCDSRRKRVAENREAQGIVRPCTLCFISPLWGGRRAQRSEYVGWGPPPEIASQFRPPHKGEVGPEAQLLSQILKTPAPTLAARKPRGAFAGFAAGEGFGAQTEFVRQRRAKRKS